MIVHNGRRIFVRGGSLEPLDMFPGRTSAAATEQMFKSILDGGMNALRIWGGGGYLPPTFYELADRYGVLLLHDVALTWYPNVPYPAFPAFRERIHAETREQASALARHPSIVLWFGGNEDQCTRYDPRYPTGCTAAEMQGAATDSCAQEYADCVSLYVDTALAAVAEVSAVPLWPASPSAGWAAGVDTASGLPDGSRLVEREDAVLWQRVGVLALATGREHLSRHAHEQALRASPHMQLAAARLLSLLRQLGATRGQRRLRAARQAGLQRLHRVVRQGRDQEEHVVSRVRVRRHRVAVRRELLHSIA